MNKELPYQYDEEEYPKLTGPDGWECKLTELEDRTWTRDLKCVVDKLNEYYEAIEFMKKKYKELHEQNILNSKSAYSTSHVIIEHSDFPNDALCQCEDCKTVAKALDDAGFTDGIEDKWWNDTKEEE